MPSAGDAASAGMATETNRPGCPHASQASPPKKHRDRSACEAHTKRNTRELQIIRIGERRAVVRDAEDDVPEQSPHHPESANLGEPSSARVHSKEDKDDQRWDEGVVSDEHHRRQDEREQPPPRQLAVLSSPGEEDRGVDQQREQTDLEP